MVMKAVRTARGLHAAINTDLRFKAEWTVRTSGGVNMSRHRMHCYRLAVELPRQRAPLGEYNVSS